MTANIEYVFSNTDLYSKSGQHGKICYVYFTTISNFCLPMSSLHVVPASLEFTVILPTVSQPAGTTGLH